MKSPQLPSLEERLMVRIRKELSKWDRVEIDTNKGAVDYLPEPLILEVLPPALADFLAHEITKARIEELKELKSNMKDPETAHWSAFRALDQIAYRLKELEKGNV